MTRAQVLAKVGDFKTRGCACKDKACATPIQTEYEKWAQRPSTIDDKEIDDLVIDYQVCVGTLVDTVVVVDQVAQMKEWMCACKDKACADRVNDRYTRWGTAMASAFASPSSHPTKPDDEAAKRMTDVAMAYGECMTKAMGATP
jgi:hypothetical protein